MSPRKVVNKMKIVDTSNGPAIDDDGYVILPTDTQGLLHLAALNPSIVNELLDSVSSYIETGLASFNSRVRLTEDGDIAVPSDEVNELLHEVSKSHSAASLMFQISRGLLPALAQADPSEVAESEAGPRLIAPGYDYMVYQNGADAPEVPVSYYATFDLIPQKILDGAVNGSYTIHVRTSESGENRPMEPAEISSPVSA